jgi:gamma-glutamyltranspeptidase
MKGVVACAEPLPTLAGAHALRLGASAIDAAREDWPRAEEILE